MIALLLAACTPPEPRCEALDALSSDDPADWDVPAGSYTPVVSEPRFLIPSDALPIATQTSNNNVALAIAGGRTYVAWRTAPTHFASIDAAIHVISADEPDARVWTHEASFTVGADVREPAFLLSDGALSMSFFEGGTNPLAFEPHAVWRAAACDGWAAAPISEGEKVPWDVKTRGGVALRTAYSGDHYGAGDLSVHLERSDDGGITWVPFGADPVLQGGDSEVAFEIAADGRLWAVTRNEDGDATGAGSKVCVAPADDWSAWDCPDVSDPERYDSPELIRHGDDLWLLARRDVGGPFGPDGDLLAYSTRPKRSALYRIDQDARAVVWVQDLPGVGDTAFVSAWRTGLHTWAFANYTAPLDEPDVTWLAAQTSDRGTQIYLAELRFEAD